MDMQDLQDGDVQESAALLMNRAVHARETRQEIGTTAAIAASPSTKSAMTNAFDPDTEK